MKNEEEVGFVLHPQQPIPTISHSIMACISPHEFPHQLHRSEHRNQRLIIIFGKCSCCHAHLEFKYMSFLLHREQYPSQQAAVGL